jgi:hypothetical protein
MWGPGIAADPAGLTTIGADLEAAARALPLTCPAGASVGDGVADAALQEFSARWAARLEALREAVQLTARQADLTALAFRIAGA